MNQIATYKYQAGAQNIEYNMVCDTFSFCHDIENKFDILINDAAVSPNRRYFAVVYVPGTMRIFRTSDAKLLHTVSEVRI